MNTEDKLRQRVSYKRLHALGLELAALGLNSPTCNSILRAVFRMLDDDYKFPSIKARTFAEEALKQVMEDLAPSCREKTHKKNWRVYP